MPDKLSDKIKSWNRRMRDMQAEMKEEIKLLKQVRSNDGKVVVGLEHVIERMEEFQEAVDFISEDVRGMQLDERVRGVSFHMDRARRIFLEEQERREAIKKEFMERRKK